MSRYRKLWLLFGGVISILIILIGVVAYLGREGYLYPVPYVKYASDGSVDEEGFRMRELNGVWYEQGKIVRYNPNGKRLLEGRYNHGTQVGKWTEWADDGTITEVSEYHDSPDNITWLSP